MSMLIIDIIAVAFAMVMGFYIGWNRSTQYRSVSRMKIIHFSTGKCGDAFDCSREIIKYLEDNKVMVTK